MVVTFIRTGVSFRKNTHRGALERRKFGGIFVDLRSARDLCRPERGLESGRARGKAPSVSSGASCALTCSQVIYAGPNCVLRLPPCRAVDIGPQRPGYFYSSPRREAPPAAAAALQEAASDEAL
jgi:hypothetical protein